MAGDVYGVQNVLENRIRKVIRPMEAEAALEYSKRVKQDNLLLLKQDVYNTFYSILLARMELEKEEQKLEIAKARFETAKARHAKKIISDDDLEMAEYNVFSKTMDYDSVLEKLKLLDMNLKTLMNLPLGGDQIEIKGEINQEVIREINLEDAINFVDKDIFAAYNKYLSAKKVMEFTDELFDQQSETYIENKRKLEMAYNEYEKSKRNREVNIRNTYNDLLNLRDNVNLAERYEVLQKKKLDTESLRYEKGQVDIERYYASKESYIDAAYYKNKAICDFNAKIRYFNALTGID
jgi:outer membrane protein TolC